MFHSRFTYLAKGGLYVIHASLVICSWPAYAQSITAEQLIPTAQSIKATELNTAKTALDRYVAAPDDTYSWKVVSKQLEPGATVFVIDLKSQTWLRSDEVDRNVWQHWLTIVKPDKSTAHTALLFIGGGRNGKNPPRSADQRTMQLAMATNSVVASLGMVPNQPLIFHDDGQPRREDDLICYTWDYYLKTGDDRWPARLPMVKSVVRAMDAIQSFLASDDAGNFQIDDFVIAGGSKRGWTTWMTAAVDPRVKAMAPIVIDVLNTNVSMRHHYSAYGFWAPAIDDYVHHKITHRRFQPRYAELLQLVDPFAYRDRFTMPKCIINATGDQFFLPDSSRFYFEELPAEKHLCYVPNGDHSLAGTNALDTLAAFHYAICNDVARPKFSWSFPDDSTIRVVTESQPVRVLLWQATNSMARDFRVDTIGRAYRDIELAPEKKNTYVAKVDPPESGWTAFFAQLEFDIGAPTLMRLSTPVRVVPDTLPFVDKVAPLIGE